MSIVGGRPNDRRIVAHLMVRDTARAIEFYQKAFAAEVLYQAPIAGGKVLHAHLKLADSVFLLSEENMAVSEGDEGPTRSPQRAGGTTVVLELYVADVDEAFAHAIAAGATPKLPLAPAIYGDRYGQLLDPFGHVWGLSMVQEILTPEEIERRMSEHFGLN